MLKLLSVVFCLLCNISGVTWAMERPEFGMEVSYLEDDNLNNGLEPASVPGLNTVNITDTMLHLVAHARLEQKAGVRSKLGYEVTLEHSKHKEFETLDNTTVGLGVRWNFSITPGFYAPRFQFFLGADKTNYEDVLRDSSSIHVQGHVSEYITDRITVLFGLGYREREADIEPVFDNKENRVFVNIDYMLTEHSTFYISFGKQSSDIVTTNVGSVPRYGVWADALFVPTLADTAYGREPFYILDANGNLVNPVGLIKSYRMRADIRTVSLGLNYAFNEKSSLDLSWLSADAEAKRGPHEYEREFLRLSYLFNF